MSDYLGNILARSLGPVAGLRPQLRSVFEPVALATPVEPAVEFNPENTVESAPVSRPPEAHRAALPRTNATRPPTTAEPVRRSEVHPIFQTQNARVGNRDESSRMEAEAAPATRPRRAEPLEPAAPEPNHRRLPAPAIAFRVPVPPDPVLREPSDLKSMAPRPIEPKPSGVSQSRPNEPLATDPIRAVVPAARSVTAAPTRPATPSMPTINVTIGRVEIRAAAPVARPRATARGPKTLSLDDYVRQRANGGAR